MNQIAENVIIGNNVVLGKNVTIKSGCILEDNIVIGDNCYLDYNVIVHSNVQVGACSTIGACCILGEYLQDFYVDQINKEHILTIGKHALIRSGTIIYGQNKIGNNFQTGHRVTIRENSNIGNNVRIGTLSDIQGWCEIQDYVNLHSNVHIGQKSIVKKYVWIFPYVVLTNDPTPPSNELLGVTIEEYAIISTKSIILPGKHLQRGALVGAAAVVTKDVGENKIVVGNPAKEIGDTSIIKNKLTGENVYPWPYSFDRGMPWEGIGFDNWQRKQAGEY